MVAIRMGRFAGVRQPLIDATADERHRVRAAAARALALVGDPMGEKTVMAMLADARAGHRMAGIWVVQRLLRAGVLAPGAELATAIDTLTSEDRVSTIRRRGAECQATLQRELDVKFQPASGD